MVQICKAADDAMFPRKVVGVGGKGLNRHRRTANREQDFPGLAVSFLRGFSRFLLPEDANPMYVQVEHGTVHGWHTTLSS